MPSSICVWINGWVNNREAGDWDAIVPTVTSLIYRRIYVWRYQNIIAFSMTSHRWDDVGIWNGPSGKTMSSLCCIFNGVFADGWHQQPWYWPGWPHCPCYVTWSLRWRHNGRDSVSNHQLHICLLNRLFRCWSKKTSKLRVTGLCAGNSPGTGEFPAQMASYVKNVSMWWRLHVGSNSC